MRHCCQFRPDDVYYLKDNELFTSRKLSIGFCPICGKPVSELSEWRFDGICNVTKVAGIDANDLVIKLFLAGEMGKISETISSLCGVEISQNEIDGEVKN